MPAALGAARHAQVRFTGEVRLPQTGDRHVSGQTHIWAMRDDGQVLIDEGDLAMAGAYLIRFFAEATQAPARLLPGPYFDAATGPPGGPPGGCGADGVLHPQEPPDLAAQAGGDDGDAQLLAQRLVILLTLPALDYGMASWCTTHFPKAGGLRRVRSTTDPGLAG